MNALTKSLTEYLTLRRALGFTLERVETNLRHFLALLARRRVESITTALALEFAAQPHHRAASTQAGCLSAVRGFARYLAASDPRTAIPPVGLLPKRYRPQPYIYSDQEIRQLLDAARHHPSNPHCALLPWTLHGVIGLLAVTGMRLMEALSLRAEDIDWSAGVLTVGRAKFQKSRLIPLHESTLRQLRHYAKSRDAFFAGRPLCRPVDRFFVTTQGSAYTSTGFGCQFRELTRQTGLRARGAPHGPRLHDLRHRFAVTTLLRWYRSGKKVDPLLPVLSTYLGHGRITGTYWYLTCTPGLRQAAGKRLEARWKGVGNAH